MRNSAYVALSASLCFTAGSVSADLAGNYRLSLENEAGVRQHLAQVEIRHAEQGYRYWIDWLDAPFENHFLSMRPFKCLPHPQRMICRLPYPYEIKRRITANDLTDLEYDLLFLHKVPGEYGINAWNGLYYVLKLAGRDLIGELHETDLNVLQAPPEKGDLRPIDPMEIHPASESLWPRRLLLEQIP